MTDTSKRPLLTTPPKREDEWGYLKRQAETE